MSQPAFLARLRERNQPPEEQYEEPARTPFDAANPFSRAAGDLAVEWEAMKQERDSARDKAEHHRGENIHLAATVDRLTKELATRISFFELELERQTLRADRAVADNATRKGRFEIIAKALSMALDDEVRVQRETPAQYVPLGQPMPDRASSIAAQPPRQPQPRDHSVSRLTDKYIERGQTFNETPREGFETSDEDAEDARALINRLAPVVLKR